eukprot:211348-Chlamydomonas_euryale.AAC.2
MCGRAWGKGGGHSKEALHAVWCDAECEYHTKSGAAQGVSSAQREARRRVWATHEGRLRRRAHAQHVEHAWARCSSKGPGHALHQARAPLAVVLCANVGTLLGQRAGHARQRVITQVKAVITQVNAVIRWAKQRAPGTLDAPAAPPLGCCRAPLMRLPAPPPLGCCHAPLMRLPRPP